MLLRVSCIFVADGARTGLQGEELLEVEPLVCRVPVMVFRACPGVDLSKPEWLFVCWLQFLGIASLSKIDLKNSLIVTSCC